MLEDKIEKLTQAVEALTAAITSTPVATSVSLETPTEPDPKEVATETTAHEAEETTPDTPTHTHDSIKAAALAISRKARDKRQSIKDKIAELGGSVVTDIEGDDLQTLGNWIEALKEEVGA